MTRFYLTLSYGLGPSAKTRGPKWLFTIEQTWYFVYFYYLRTFNKDTQMICDMIILLFDLCWGKDETMK